MSFHLAQIPEGRLLRPGTTITSSTSSTSSTRTRTSTNTSSTCSTLLLCSARWTVLDPAQIPEGCFLRPGTTNTTCSSSSNSISTRAEY